MLRTVFTLTPKLSKKSITPASRFTKYPHYQQARTTMQIHQFMHPFCTEYRKRVTKLWQENTKKMEELETGATPQGLIVRFFWSKDSRIFQNGIWALNFGLEFAGFGRLAKLPVNIYVV
jgi:hypothetical protein